jgi:hypothetical protein
MSKDLINAARKEVEAKEKEAISELRNLYSTLRQTQTIQESQAEDPRERLQLGSMGVAPLIWGAVAGGAIVLTQLFGYLGERERRLQQELGGGSSMFGFLEGNVMKLAAVAIGGYLLWNWFSESEEEKAAKDAAREMGMDE